MLHAKVDYEWSTVSNEEWARLPPANPTAATGGVVCRSEQRLLIHLGRVAALLLVLWGAMASVAQPVPLPITPAALIAPTLQLEAQAWQTRNANLLAALVDARVKPTLQTEWRIGWDQLDPAADPAMEIIDIRPVDDLIIVQTRVDHAGLEWWLSSPYRETRFYRPVGDGWVRTAPDAAFWGATRTIETTHLQFTFYEVDAPAVLAAADRLERAFTHAYTWLALELPPAEQKLRFTVVADVVRGVSGYAARQQLTSPFLAKIPLLMSDDDYLAQQVVSRITSLAVNGRMTNYDFSNIYAWDTMLWALKGWLRTAVLEQRTPWHRQAEQRFRQQMMPAAPFRLAQISDRYELDVLDQPAMMLEYMLAESVIDYGIRQYGRDRLPELVLGFNRHASWRGLIPGVFGVSQAEFEAGWNRYLRIEYGRIERVDE